MKIDSLKDLEKLIKSCRKLGVKSISLDCITLELGDVPTVYKTSKKLVSENTFIPGGVDQNTQIEMPDMLSPEQLLFYSSNANPEGQ